MSFILLAITLCLLGSILGNISGVFPGITPLTVFSIALPISFTFNDPILSLIFLSSVYCGCAYGETLSSAIARTPGEISTAIINEDVWKFARRNKAPIIISISTLSSFLSSIVALVSICGVIFLCYDYLPTMLSFSPWTLCIVLLLAMVSPTLHPHKNIDISRYFISLSIGLLIGCIGDNTPTGISRFIITDWITSFTYVPIISIAFFGILNSISELFVSRPTQFNNLDITYNISSAIKRFPPRVLLSSMRGSLIGWICGIIPGIHAVVPASLSYSAEAAIKPCKLNRIAAVEAANNSHHMSSYIPMLLAGIPTNVIMSMVLLSLTINGGTPSINFINQHYNNIIVFICCLLLSNIFLLILNIKAVNVWAKLITLPKPIIHSAAIVCCVLGVYFIHSSILDVLYLFAWTLIGAGLRQLRYSTIAIVVGAVLASMFEENLTRSLVLLFG